MDTHVPVKEDWMNKKWRPMMGWTYMITCVFDFLLFPIMWSMLQAIQQGNVTSQWNPITLQGAGLYHVAMGAVLGVAAYSRGREKLAGVADSQVNYQQSSHGRPDYHNAGRGGTGRVFISKSGKPGPVIEEPLL